MAASSKQQNSNALTIIPLGGLGEVGMNMMVYEAKGRIIVVDAGVLFPDADMPGVDMVFADINYLVENRDRIDAIFLTHGHEDHIGAVPFLLREIDVPIYGTPMTLALLSAKLKEHRLDEMARLRPVKAGESASAGPFTVEFIHVTHSIIDAAAFAITTPAGVIVHTGDFKIDHTPVDGEHFDSDRLRELGDAGVLALLSDSTNSETPGHTKSESDVGRTLNQLFGELKGRIILATFSSNIHRIQQVIDAAQKHGKKVAIVGRSMEQNSRITREMGLLHAPDDTVVPIHDLPDDPNSEVVIVTTGSQGEPMSALSRMAMGEHRNVSLQPGDTVMLSSRTIPGNEVSIGRVINHLYRLGIRVVHAKLSEIHVSGHAAVEEQEEMLALTRPRFFVPIHGEWRMMVNHAETAQRMGVPKERVAIIENGDRLRLSADTIKKLDPIEAGRTFVDGNALHEGGELILRDRRNLSAGGILVVVIGLDMHTGKVLLGPELLNRGFLAEDHSENLEPELIKVAKGAIASLDKEARADPEVVRVRVRNRLRKHIEKTLRRRPIVMPMVLEM
jgi:ribonuclease J